MTTTAQETVAEQNTKAPQVPVDPKIKKRAEEFRQRIDICKQYKRKLIQNWTTSIDYRRGKPFASQTDEDQIAVNLDWSYTKTKQATLFSQVPQIHISHPFNSAQAGPWLAAFEAKLNDTLIVAGIEAAMDEVLPDVINAAGFGSVLVSYEALTEDKEVPKADLSMFPPEVAQQILQTKTMPDGFPLEMEVVPQVVDKRYRVQRISPSDLLWPIEFIGSNFNNAKWIGRSGRITWPEAVQRFKLTEEDKEKVIGDDRTILDKLTHDLDKDKISADQNVGFDEIFFISQAYDPDSKSFSAIHHMVFINGKDAPVVDEPWKGQKIGPDGTIIGAKKCPLQVLTLSYITDEAIPPSDSAVGRPQVDEINKIRSQQIRQRERSLPVRWADVNRVDPAVMQGLMRGTWQSFIPVQGDGTRVIGEVASAKMPPENGTFHMIAKNDLSEMWSIGPNQLGSGEDVETKGESGEIAANFQTRVGRERAKCASFVVNIAEILGGLLCLYEDPASFGEEFNPGFSANLAFSITPDSTVLLDSNQRLKNLNQFMNVYGKSGFVEIEPVLREIAILTGLDPNTCIKTPEPKPPVEPSISLRLTGSEDMMNPLLLALLIKSGQAPDPELIEKAKQLIQMTVEVPTPQPMTPPPPTDPNELPPPPPPGVGEANPDMTVMPKITKRSDDPSIGGKES